MSHYFKGGGESGRDAVWKAWWGGEREETGGGGSRWKIRAEQARWQCDEEAETNVGWEKILFSNDSLCWQPYSWLELQMSQIAKQDRPSDIRNVRPQFSTIFLWLVTFYDPHYLRHHDAVKSTSPQAQTGSEQDKDSAQVWCRGRWGKASWSVGKEEDLSVLKITWWIDSRNFLKKHKVYKVLLTSSVILEESSVTPDLILFIKINAFTWPKVWRFSCVCVWEREQKSKSAKKREGERGWDDTDACLSRVGNKFRGSCLAHSFPRSNHRQDCGL